MQEEERRSSGGETLQVLSDAEYTVNLLAQGAKAYWRGWGPVADPMVRGVDTWAEMQLAYLRWVGERLEARARGVPIPQTAPPANFPIPFLPP